jgi:N-acetylglutamate synthase-like GNAT family acetyltransferase
MDITDISITEAQLADLPRLQAVLTQVKLSTHDLLAEGTRYWLAENAQGQPVGVIGLEFGADAVLLRSAAISPDQQRRGIGAALVQRALSAAARAGYRRVYLFSTEAGSYWQRHGFREVPVPKLVAALSNAPQVKQYEQLGWLPTEIAWQLDLDEPGEGEHP